MAETKLYFSIYGVTVRVSVDSDRVSEWLTFDFHSFRTSETASPDICVEVIAGSAPDNLIPDLEETEHSPTYVSYDHGEVRYVDYYGKALVVHNHKQETATMYMGDEVFGYERLYLLILSRVGELLDKRGLHRVHALGFTYRGLGVLLLMPMRGGKSTLALRLLRQSDTTLVSEDTPLLNYSGEMLPFLVRVAVLAGEEPDDIAQENIRLFQRDNYPDKSLICIRAFEDQLASMPQRVDVILCGKWTTGDEPRLQTLGRFATLRKLFRDCVFGLGLPQVVEFFLRSSYGDILSKGGLVARRTLAVSRLVMGTKNVSFVMCRDREKNFEYLLKYLDKHVDEK